MFFKTKRHKKKLLYSPSLLAVNNRKFSIISLLTLLIFAAPSYADVLLQGYQHIGDNDISGYTPMDPVTNQQIENYPTFFHLSDNLTVTAVSVKNLVGIDGDKLQIFIDNNFVGEGSANSATVDIVDQNLTKGYHSIAVRARCFNNGGKLKDCSSNSASSDNDINFSAITLISGGTNDSINLVQRRHLGDNYDRDYWYYWYYGHYDWYDRNGQSRDPSPPYLYPDYPEGTSITFNFNVTSPVIIDKVKFFAAREINYGANFSIDGTQKGILQTNGNPIVDIEDTTLYPSGNPHTLQIESINGQGGDDDISWDSISLIGINVTSLDHILLEHDGSGLTCRGEPITVKACANDNCSALYNNQVTVNFTNPSSGWETDPVTFAGGQTTVDLTHTDNETVTIDAEAISPTANNSTQCLNTSGGTDCEIIFNDVGIIIDGDSDNTNPESNIITQIAGKPSDTNPDSETQLIRVVRKDDKTGACIPGVQNQNIDVSFSYSTPQPAQGLDDNIIQISNNTNSVNISDNTSSETLSLSFNSNGIAPFTFTSEDTGKYALNAEMDIPVTYFDNTTTGQTVTGSDATNAFVVRPLAVFANAVANPKSQNADGSVFKKAGNPFTLNFKSLQWTSGRDSDNNGIWDSCDNSTLSDPGSDYARVPQWNIGQPSVDLALPSPGNNPDLNYNNGNAGFSGSDSANSDNVTYSEVGIVQMKPASLNNFLGENVQVCSPYIGRFTPHHFKTSIKDGELNDGCSSFTYTGQQTNYLMAPQFDITAQDKDNNTTQNYKGDFFKLEKTGFDITTPTTDANQLGEDGINKVNVNINKDSATLNSNSDGTATYTFGNDNITYVKDNNSQVAPFDALINFEINGIVDNDSVSAIDLPDNISASGTEIRYGRMDILDNYGPETEPLTMQVKTEYWDGDSWELNDNDSCTSLLDTDFSLDNYTANLNSGETIIDDTSVDGIISGTGNFTLTAPGEGNNGSVDINLISYPYLLDNETTGTATFGIYRGRDRIIEWKEVPAK
ncbi:MAG: hypothetical protein FXF49_09415 [Flexistipes sinusarabici]|uniref:DUF6701 domain-containing protein n=1 Tax=Flexistipes sinusarabici TaxID=2352 RepID=A0A5D0MQ44_FLESI|nr:DUF6701 domain-containing protein [Flexistipes sinusarabici]TYB32839.1 MAG: hypothetical protein FXF49_09415 [Flexistipes sinusarabici]